jgi:hypothetical protein
MGAVTDQGITPLAALGRLDEGPRTRPSMEPGRRLAAQHLLAAVQSVMRAPTWARIDALDQRPAARCAGVWVGNPILGAEFSKELACSIEHCASSRSIGWSIEPPRLVIDWQGLPTFEIK